MSSAAGDVLGLSHQATASAAAAFLGTVQDRLPFPLRAIEVGGGSEFKADFERTDTLVPNPVAPSPDGPSICRVDRGFVPARPEPQELTFRGDS